jgi:hypothetical protein
MLQKRRSLLRLKLVSLFPGLIIPIAIASPALAGCYNIAPEYFVNIRYLNNTPASSVTFPFQTPSPLGIFGRTGYSRRIYCEYPVPPGYVPGVNYIGGANVPLTFNIFVDGQLAQTVRSGSAGDFSTLLPLTEGAHTVSVFNGAPFSVFVPNTATAPPSKTLTINNVQITAYAFYRYFNSAAGDHFYTANYGELGPGRGGYLLEGVQAYIPLQQYPGTIPLYRYWSLQGTDHFYTTNFSELGSGGSGYTYEGIAGYVYPTQAAGTVPLYRYWNLQATDHFYTTNFSELGSGSGGYVYEGIAGYVIP